MSRHRAALISLFDRVRKLEADPFGVRLVGLSIQEELIDRLSKAERSIRRLRGTIGETKQALRHRGNTKSVAAAHKAQIQRLHDAVERQKDIIDTLRDIGDAVAFIYVDRFDLKPLAFKEAPGFITGKRGARLERQTFRIAYEKGFVGILNDLTHTLRHGDVTILGEGRPMMLIECKSGKGGKRSRGDRQIAEAQIMLDYLRDDFRDEEGGSWHRVEALEPPVSLADKATSLVQRLPEGGWLREEVEPGLHYVVVDCLIEDGGIEQALSNVDPEWKPYVIVVNQMKRAELGYMPFPLHFTDVEVTYRFYNGEFVMAVIVELRTVVKRLEELGFLLEIMDDGDMPFKLSPIGGDEETAGVSFVGFHPMGRLAAEFVSLEWLICNVMAGPPLDHLLDELRKQAGKPFQGAISNHLTEQP